MAGDVVGGDRIPVLIAPAFRRLVADGRCDQVAVGGELGLRGDLLFPPGD
jgi:hypothetical protein